MLDPNTIDKYLYITKTPTWKVRTIYIFGIISWLLIWYGFWGAWTIDPFFRWFVVPIIFILGVYQLASFGLNLLYRQFGLQAHQSFVKRFWKQPSTQLPSIDIHIPISGEHIDVLKHSWKHVAMLQYPNKKVYILDDSKEHCEQHKTLAEQYGFIYLERPNKGEMKKAGNLKFGFQNSYGEFIIVFDADFAPRRDLIIELLPYMSDPSVAIVQSPQYFETTSSVHKQSPLEYGAAYAEEPFYRYIQVVRDRVGATICCGSNAVYRRSALQAIGGPIQVPHSEDARTGFALMCKGYRVKYIPIILAVGLCPSNVHAYFHQQHRWCSGTMSLMLSKEFWLSPLKPKSKFAYVTGFMFYLHHPIVILFSFQLFWTFFMYNEYIHVMNAIVFYPHVMFALLYLFAFPIARLRKGYFLALMLQTYAYAHAVFSSILYSTVGWVTTGSKQNNVSPAFQQTMNAVRVYILSYGTLLLFSALIGYLHLFDANYYSIQFWLFYNMILSTHLFWQMRKYYKSTQQQNSVTDKTQSDTMIVEQKQIQYVN